MQKALDFVMNVDPGNEGGSELHPIVAAVGAICGDPYGKYASFLAHAHEAYPADPYFLWNQPLSDKGWVSRYPTSGNSNTTKKGDSDTSIKHNSGSIRFVAGTLSLATLSVLAAWLVT